MSDVDVPQAEHLIALNLDLSLAVASRDCSAIRYLAQVSSVLLTHNVLMRHLMRRSSFVLDFRTVEVLCMGRRLTLANRLCSFIAAIYRALRTGSRRCLLLADCSITMGSACRGCRLKFAVLTSLQ